MEYKRRYEMPVVFTYDPISKHLKRASPSDPNAHPAKGYSVISVCTGYSLKANGFKLDRDGEWVQVWKHEPTEIEGVKMI